MELSHSFTVPVPLDQAWDVLLDVERVAPCMPGATLDSVDGDDITGKIKVKVGPISMTYAGKAHFTERDRAAGVVVLEAAGKETRGAGTASATVRSELTGTGNETHVTVLTSLNVTGKPAQFGRGVLSEVGGRLVGIFADNLARMLTAEPVPAQPAPAETVAEAQSAAEAAPAAPSEPAAATPAAATAAAGTRPDPSAAMALPIEELNLPLRAYNSLRKEGVATVADLVARTPQQLLEIENIGPASVEEIRQRLADHGLTLSHAAASANGSGAPGTVAAAAPGTAPQPPAGTLRPVPAAPAAAAAGSSSWEPDDDAIDLLSVAGMPVLRRAAPVAAGAVVIALVAVTIRRRRRRRG
jgi:carbon monoxide dehydrogenase subunit G